MGLSESVQREFDRWQEGYSIDLLDEFLVKTLLKLQDEYNSITPGSDNTLTRQTLLDMILRLQSSLSYDLGHKTHVFANHIDGGTVKLTKDNIKNLCEYVISKLGGNR